jgi:hypothetical protein
MMSDMNNNNNRVGEAAGSIIASGRSPRFSLWIALVVFSTITLGSSVEIVRFSM